MVYFGFYSTHVVDYYDDRFLVCIILFKELFLSGVTAAILRFSASSPVSKPDPPLANIMASALAVLTGKFPKPVVFVDFKVCVLDICGFPRLLRLTTTVFSLEFPRVRLL